MVSKSKIGCPNHAYWKEQRDWCLSSSHKKNWDEFVKNISVCFERDGVYRMSRLISDWYNHIGWGLAQNDSLELIQENVPKNQYQILEMEHQIDGFVKMQLGRFSKGMEDRFAELLITTNSNKAKIRSKELIQSDENVSLLDLISLRERKILIQKRESLATTNKIGFVRTIGFTTPMGTAGITTTTIREVEL